jgi:ribosomal protein S6--L-glutamate ligase
LRAQRDSEKVTPFDVEKHLALLAIRTGDALGLDIFGVDVLFGDDGPVLIDVNPFPGFRGVTDAVRMIANHIATVAM